MTICIAIIGASRLAEAGDEFCHPFNLLFSITEKTPQLYIEAKTMQKAIWTTNFYKNNIITKD